MTGRHFTTAVTLLVLLGILALGAVFGVKTMFKPIEGSAGAAASASPSPTCAAENLKKGQRIHSRQIEVSVYNAGTRPGLAGKTMRSLVRRGFKRGATGNAPSSAKLRFVQVWTTKKHDPAAKLVALQFGTNTLIRVTKTDLGPGIEVLVGNDFRGLKKAPRSSPVKKRQQVCLPATS